MVLGFREAFRTHEFFVEIEGIESPAITRVSGLTDGEVDSIDQPSGGSNIIHKVSSGIIRFGDLTLERNMDGSAADGAFLEWFTTMFTLDGTGTGSALRRNGSVVIKQNSEEIMRFVFTGAWIKSSNFTDLEAGNSALFKQTIVLSVETMYRA